MNSRDPRRGRTWAHWSLSIALHLALVGIVTGAWLWSNRHPSPQPLAIQGSVVTAAELEPATVPPPEPTVVIEPAPEPEPEPELEPEPAAEEPPPPEPDPAQRQAEQSARLAEEQRQAELAAQRQAEERAARERAERERLARERAARERAEREQAERERQARERAERERREREQAELARREAELAAQLEAERQRQAVRGSAAARQYVDMIRATVERNWRRPATARVGLACEVRVTQVPGGTVTGVSFGRCNADQSVRQSIEDAVYRSSPLPQPPDPALFERELIFNFAPQD